tara:strand:+ start:371 stop:1102 length:732 start_codon:yes stop_codon:yes gene_type:complete
MGLNLTKNYSYNFGPSKRAKKLIKFIILHYTGMKKETDAIKKLCDYNSKVSSHYFIKNNGQILNLVPDLYEAWHAGKSKWKKFKSLNKYSIGIEINNPGHEFGYNTFNLKQINSLKKLLSFLIQKYNIKLDNVLGHSDIAPDRKKDPGEKFPWEKLAKKRLCKWHNLNRKKIKKFRSISVSVKEKKIFLNNLSKIGYNLEIKKIFDKNTRFIIIAYQRHFRQELIDGKIDKECLLISKNLIKS